MTYHRICCYCKRHMGTVEGAPSKYGNETHGICEECMAKLRAELAEHAKKEGKQCGTT